MKKIYSFIILIVLTTGLWAQSPWIQEKGTLLAQVSWNTISNYNQLYLSSGETYSTERKLTDNTFQGWFEYGLFNSTSLLLITPFKVLKAGDLVDVNNQDPQTTAGSFSTLGNISFIWKQKLLHQDWILTSHVIVDFQTADYQDGTGLRSGYDARTFSVVLSAGRGFGKTYFYAHLGIGTRSNNYSNIFTAGFEWGYHIARPVWVAVVINALQSFENGTRQDPVNNRLTGLYVNDQEYISWGIKLFGPIIPDKFGYNAAIFGAFSGNYVAKAPSLNLGLYYTFSFF
jgi:hypothetical protein